MIVRIVLPHLESGLTGGTVTKWHVKEGSQVAFGEPICDVAIAERLMLRPLGGADRLVERIRLGGRRQSPTRTENEGFSITYRILASEPATITDLAVSEGGLVTVGGLLGRATTGGAVDEDRAPTRTLEPGPMMRVAATPASEGDI